jgi:hypothetical protein
MINVRAISYDRRVHLFWMLVSIFVISSLFYMYAVLSTTQNTAKRASLEVKLSNLSAETSALEFAYINKKNGVNMDIAYSSGFKDVVNPRYISRVKSSSLSLNTSSR